MSNRKIALIAWVCLPLYYAGWQANRHSGGQYGEHKKGSDSARSKKEKKEGNSSNKKRERERHGARSPRPRGSPGESAGGLGGWAGASGSGACRAVGATEGAGRSPDSGVAAAGRGRVEQQRENPEDSSPQNVSGRRRPGIFGGVRGGSRSLPLATGGVGGTPATAFVGGDTAGSPQPSPISVGALRKRPKGGTGPDGVQPRGAEAAVPGAGPGNGGPPIRVCATAGRPGKEVAAAGDTLGGRRSRAGGPGAVSGGAAHGHGGLGTMPPALQSRGRRNLGRGSPRPAPRPHAGGEAGAGTSKEASSSFGARRLSPGARATSTWRFTLLLSPPSPRLRDGLSRPAGSASDARTGVLAVRTAGPLPPRVPAHGGGAGGPGGWPAYLCSRFGGGILHSGKGARE